MPGPSDTTSVESRTRDNPITFVHIADWPDTTENATKKATAQRIMDYINSRGDVEFILQSGDFMGGNLVAEDHHDSADETIGQYRYWFKPTNALTWGDQEDSFAGKGAQATVNGDGVAERNTYFQNWVNNSNKWFPALGNHDYIENPDRSYAGDYDLSYFQEFTTDFTEGLSSGVTSDKDDPWHAGTSDFANGNGKNQNYQINWKGVEILNYNNIPSAQNKDAFDYNVGGEGSSTYAGPGNNWIAGRIVSGSPSDARWGIINAHYPMYCSGNTAQKSSATGAWDPTSEAHSGRKWRIHIDGVVAINNKFRVFLQGHDHSFEHVTKTLGSSIRHFFTNGTCGGVDTPSGSKGTGGAYPLDFTTEYRNDDNATYEFQPHVLIFKASRNYLDVEAVAVTAAKPDGVSLYSTAIKHEETGMADSISWKVPFNSGPGLKAYQITYSGNFTGSVNQPITDILKVPDGCVGVTGLVRGSSGSTHPARVKILCCVNKTSTDITDSQWEDTNAYINMGSAMVFDEADIWWDGAGFGRGGPFVLTGQWAATVAGRNEMAADAGRRNRMSNYAQFALVPNGTYDLTSAELSFYFWFDSGELALKGFQQEKSRLGLG